jgi:hypothetical protein
MAIGQCHRHAGSAQGFTFCVTGIMWRIVWAPAAATWLRMAAKAARLCSCELLRTVRLSVGLPGQSLRKTRLLHGETKSYPQQLGLRRPGHMSDLLARRAARNDVLLATALHVDSGIAMRNGDEDDTCGIGGWHSWYPKPCSEAHEGMRSLAPHRNPCKIKAHHF